MQRMEKERGDPALFLPPAVFHGRHPRLARRDADRMPAPAVWGGEGTMRRGPALKRSRLLGSYDRRHKLIGLAFSLPAILFLILFVVYPVCYNVWLSFTNTSLIKKTSEFIWLDNYVRLFDNQLFWKYFWNTCKWTFWSVLGQLALGLGIALLIARPMKGGTALRSFLLIPYVVPAITLALVSRWMLNNEYGIISHWLQQAGWLQEGQSLLAMQGSAMWVVVILNI